MPVVPFYLFTHFLSLLGTPPPAVSWDLSASFPFFCPTALAFTGMQAEGKGCPPGRSRTGSRLCGSLSDLLGEAGAATECSGLSLEAERLPRGLTLPVPAL